MTSQSVNPNFVVNADVLDVINSARRLGCDAAELHVNYESGFSVSVREGALDIFQQQQEQALSLTVFKNHCSATVSSTDFSASALNATLTKAMSLVMFTQPDECRSLADSHQLAFNYPELSLYHPWTISSEEAICLAIDMDDAISNHDKRIMHCESANVSTTHVHHVYANSMDFVGSYSYTVHQQSCAILASDSNGKQQHSEYDIQCRSEALSDPVNLAITAAEETCRRLSPRKLKTQQSSIIFSAPCARGLIAIFLRAINGHNIYRQSSFLMNNLSSQVFPEFFSVYQRPHEQGVLHSAPFDNEGVRLYDMPLVEAGCFNYFLCDSYSARRLKCSSTGHAGGARNVYVKSSGVSFSEMCARMGRGLYVTDLMGQGVNLINGDYSRGASGFWVENGEVQYPVDEVTIAGNLRDMFRNIVAVADDLDQRGNIKTGSILIESMTIAGI